MPSEASLQHLAQRVLAAAGLTRGPGVWHRDLPETNPAEHSADVPVPLPQLQEGVEGLAVDQPEVADVHMLVNLGQPAQQAVVEPRRRLLQEGLTLPALPDGVHDLVAFLPPRCHLEDDLRWILEVGVHDRQRHARTRSPCQP